MRKKMIAGTMTERAKPRESTFHGIFSNQTKTRSEVDDHQLRDEQIDADT
jgi:hypothetical protein